MNPYAALVTFAVLLPAELPDKTFIASLVLGSRFSSAFLVWAGVAAAFTLHAAVAVVAGGLLALLPRQTLDAVVAFMFACGGAYLILWPERRREEKGEEMAAVDPSAHRVFLTAFGVVFVGEWGDISQILIANLAARYNSPVYVFMGATAALLVLAALAVGLGRALPRVVPLSLVSRLAGVLLIVLAVISAVSAARA